MSEKAAEFSDHRQFKSPVQDSTPDFALNDFSRTFSLTLKKIFPINILLTDGIFTCDEL